MDAAYWESVYAHDDGARVPPSPFALDMTMRVLAATAHADGCPLFEAGCGNGRDAVYFAKRGVKVEAVDFSQAAVDALVERKEPNAVFSRADFTRMGEQKEKYAVVYSRFTLHAVNAEGARRFINWSARALRPGGFILIEARSVADELYGQGTRDKEDQDAWWGGPSKHYRRFLRLHRLIADLETAGFVVEEAGQRRGWAKHGDADPEIIRVCAHTRHNKLP
jgi:tellurite methyltransferase